MPTFKLEEYLQARKTLIESALISALPPADDYTQDLTQAMQHALLAGGKRIRPILCLAAADAISTYNPDTISAAVAIEFLHTYTLVHDDLPCMDNDTMRRGKPSVWAKFGEGLAVLTGDALQALSFAQIAKIPNLTAILATAAGTQGVIAGQVADINSVKPDFGNWNRSLLDYVFRHKTADLFIAAMKMGAKSVNATQNELDVIENFALKLGVTFQIIDDILDAGQATDKAELSCLAIMSETEAKTWAERLTLEACDSLEKLSGNTTPLKELAETLLKRIQ